MKALLLLTAMMMWGGISGAQQDDVVPGPHAGKMQEVAGVQVELFLSETGVRICVYDAADVPLNVEGYTGYVEIVSGGERQTITLTPADKVTLAGQGKGLLAPYSLLTLFLTTPKGESGKVSF